MITLELNGRKVEAETEREARKALAKMIREEAKETARREEDYKAARLEAQSGAYDLIRRILTNEPIPSRRELYSPHSKYGVALAAPDNEERDVHHIDAHGTGKIRFAHNGLDLLGVIDRGNGYVWGVILRDRFTGEITVNAIGVCGKSWALADCPNATPEHFAKGE